jgi:hypothetical protein
MTSFQQLTAHLRFAGQEQQSAHKDAGDTNCTRRAINVVESYSIMRRPP